MAGFLTAVLLCLPFGLSVLEPVASAPFFRSGLIDQIVIAGGGYPYLTVNAYNAWAIVPSDLGISLASAGLWVCDAGSIPADQCGAGVAVFGAVPAVAVGAVLLIASFVAALWAAARHPDRLTLLVVLAVLALAFFALPTRVHERYGFPFFALGAILFAISPRWRVAYVVLAIATFANMYVVLTTLYPPEFPDQNAVRDWLAIGAVAPLTGRGDDRRDHAYGGVRLGRAPVASERPRTTRRRAGRGAARGRHGRTVDPPRCGHPRRDPGPRSRRGRGVRAGATAWRPCREGLEAPTRPSRPAPPRPRPRDRRPTCRRGACVPRSPTAASSGWIRTRLADRPVRADRSRMLLREGGGRLDRLDAWILVVLLLATLGMRTFRLEEPYQPHFDEVYHARTAMEFLQDWRYGESHDIYEWTHPHLAKYAMAAGLVLWGEDDVSGTGDLGHAGPRPPRSSRDGKTH